MDMLRRRSIFAEREWGRESVDCLHGGAREGTVVKQSEAGKQFSVRASVCQINCCHR
jgi:hypothetical protein